LIQIILSGLGYAQLFGQGRAVPLARSGQLGAGIDQTRDDHGQDQIPLPARLRANHLTQLEPVDHFQDRLHMAVGKGLLGGEQILRRDQGLVAQQAAEELDLFRWPIGEIGQGALVGFVAFASHLAVAFKRG